MSDQYLFDAIQALTGNKNRVSAERIYCQAMGNDLTGGMFLSQLIFWCDKGKRADGFFYKTAVEWEQETFLSTYLVRKYTKQCEEYGWLETKVMKANGSPTVHYRLDREKFSKWICEFLQIYRKSNFSQSLTDSTTDLTTEIDDPPTPIFQPTTKPTPSAKPLPAPAVIPPTKSALSDRDGKMLIELIRQRGFMYLDSNATLLAACLEDDYTDLQLRTALDKMTEAHQKQIKTGKRGITAPLAYLRSILAGMGTEDPPATNGRQSNGKFISEWDDPKYAIAAQQIQPVTDYGEIPF